MKFVTRKFYLLVLLVAVMIQIISCQTESYSDYISNSEEMKHYKECDRLMIRFKKHIQEQEISVPQPPEEPTEFRHVLYDGDEDDLELPNTIYEEESNDEQKENYEDLPHGEMTEEELRYIFQRSRNGPLFDETEEPKGMGDFILDRYLHNTYLKGAVIVQMTLAKQGIAFV